MTSRATLLRTMARLERRQYAGRLHPSMWRRGFLSNRWYAYPGIHDPAVPFISDAAVEALLRRLNDPAGARLLEDKNVFADVVVARGLAAAAPEVYGVGLRGTLHGRSAAALDRMRTAPDVVLKPLDGAGGRGVRIVAGERVEGLVAGEPGAAVLVQERLEQHPQLRAVHPGSLNTLRALAIRLPDGDPVVAAAVHRWGTAASGAVDNVSSGGLCSAVDLATGRLGPAVGRPRERGRPTYDRHPDTGVPIAGETVPHWGEVLDLVGQLMTAFPEVTHVGWDVCVTDRGPLVLEGNAGVPNLNVFQFHGSFLADPRVRRFYIDHGLLAARHA
ncbi:sugar-transfer associated ATP-grasp domain-containing protein [Modestobacter sp. KNN46-3]|uniref:sugar-transfer associated ATP-grasp domain-containing protein n=1 Tax=Modestobacter sp. KNN46-3 TaxID=2711218 RepID=UPI0013E036BF|nr:sugar-transfer associated ATP-grasp domain-containing protein [Modestobacter sp. KNN46-3]